MVEREALVELVASSEAVAVALTLSEIVSELEAVMFSLAEKVTLSVGVGGGVMVTDIDSLSDRVGVVV